MIDTLEQLVFRAIEEELMGRNYAKTMQQSFIEKYTEWVPNLILITFIPMFKDMMRKMQQNHDEVRYQQDHDDERNSNLLKCE